MTIQFEQVDENLTDFPMFIKRTDADWQSGANSDGSDFRMTTSDEETEIPFDLVDYDSSDGTLIAFTKVGTVSSTTDTVIYIYYGNAGAAFRTEDATYGSENVWNSAFKWVLHDGAVAGVYNDATTNDNDFNDYGLSYAFGSTSGAGKSSANQSCYYDGSNYFQVGDDEITIRATITGADITTNMTAASGAVSGADHVGAIVVDDNYVYGPIEAWTNCGTFGSQFIVLYDKSTLAVVSTWDVSAQAHEMSGITIDANAGTNGSLYVSSFCDTNDIFMYDLSDGSFRGTIGLDLPIANIQGISYNSTADMIYVSSSDTEYGVWAIALDGTVRGRLTNADEVPDVMIQGVQAVSGNGAEPDLWVWGEESGNHLWYYYHTDTSDAGLSSDIGKVIMRGDGNGSDTGYGYAELTYTLTENATLSMWVNVKNFYDFNSLWDNSTNGNIWESWTYGSAEHTFRSSGTRPSYTIPTADDWYKIDHTWSRAAGDVNLELFYNGVSRDTATGTWDTPGTYHYFNGGHSGNAAGENQFGLAMISNVVRSDDWLDAEFVNQSTPATFMEYGSQESSPAGGFKGAFDGALDLQ